MRQIALSIIYVMIADHRMSVLGWKANVMGEVTLVIPEVHVSKTIFQVRVGELGREGVIRGEGR